MPRSSHHILLGFALLSTCVVCRAEPDCPTNWLPVSGLAPSTAGVQCILPLSTGNVLLTGTFTSAGGNPANGIARWNPSTGAWSSVEIGFSQLGPSESVLSLVETNSGDYILGGTFSHAGGLVVANIVRVDASTDAWLSIGDVRATSGTAWVRCLLKLPNGKIIAAGRFSTAGGVNASNIAQYDPVSGLWSPLGLSPFAEQITQVVQLPSGDLLAAGTFSTSPPYSYSRLARWSFATNLWTPLPNTSTPFCVSWPHGVTECAAIFNVMTTLSNGQVLVGGTFNSAGGVSDYGISRLVPGNSPSWFATGTQPLTTLRMLVGLPSGDAVGVGDIRLTTWQYPGVAMGRWSAAANRWTSIGTTLPIYVNCCVLLPNGELLAGGSNSSSGMLMARARAQSSRLDYDCNGELSVQDLFEYLGLWFAVSSYADFNHDGAISTYDLLEYVSAWFVGL